MYPNSAKAEEARTRIRELRQSLARAEFLAGYFYQRTRQACRAAIARYEGILKEYPDYERLDEVLFRLAECLQPVRPRRRRPCRTSARLLEEYPKSEHVGGRRRSSSCATAAAASARPVPRPAGPVSDPPIAGGKSIAAA